MSWRRTNALADAEAERRLLECGAVPVDCYPGKLGEPWKARCLTCWATIFPKLGLLKAGLRACPICRNTTDQSQSREAEEEVKETFYVLSDYAGYSSPWTVRCRACDTITKTTYKEIRAGKGCSQCRSRSLNEIDGDDQLRHTLSRIDSGTNCGVYKVLNKATGRFYVGSSANLKSRLRTHLRDLEEERHPNMWLQEDTFRFGIKSWHFSIISICNDRATALAKEQVLLSIYWGRYCCYNIEPWIEGRASTREILHAHNPITGWTANFITAHAAAKELRFDKSMIIAAIDRDDESIQNWKFSWRLFGESDRAYFVRKNIDRLSYNRAFFAKRGIDVLTYEPPEALKWIPLTSGLSKWPH